MKIDANKRPDGRVVVDLTNENKTKIISRIITEYTDTDDDIAKVMLGVSNSIQEGTITLHLSHKELRTLALMIIQYVDLLDKEPNIFREEIWDMY